MTETIDYALKYATFGFDVFPCLPKDKKPMVRWTEAATRETNMITGWWDNFPAANIGIACGKRSGIIVLDVDADHDGYESLAELIERYGKLPETPVCKTGSGGEHIFFKHPGIEIHNSASKLGKGLDIRGDGGYVVTAPSIHPNGNRYEWVVKPSQIELADMPEWMIDLLREKNIAPIESVNSFDKIISGGRNDYLTKLAGAMRRKGMSEDAMFAALIVQNREKCDPPLTDGEVLQVARSVTRYPPQDEPKIQKPLPDAWDVIEKIESEIHERAKNPHDVWGIHYAWQYLSLLTGGKQKGELIILAGEPKVGKSWWAHQDALFTAIGNPSLGIPSTPVLVWSGEMGRKQVYRRFFEMLGIPKRHMMNGQMSNEDWEFFTDAKALIVNSPIYVSDQSLSLDEVKELLEREKDAHGIEQVIFDYDWLITAPGRDEIATSQNISRTMKNLARELDLSILLISSVNKNGMDSTSETTTKTNVSGSGKKLHDADVIYIMTKFNANKNQDMNITPKDYERISTLHIAAGRELDFHLPGGAINYMRETPNPKFKELRDIKKDPLPSWITRKDM